MAENLDQNALNQINESLNDMARILPTVMQGLSQVGGIAAGTTSVKAGLDNYNKSLKEGTERQKADAFSKAEMQRKQDNLTDAMGKSTQALDAFASALFNGTGEFAKYNTALSSAGSAALAWGKNFGPLGLATGALIKGVTKAAEMALKQADDTLKATDSISKMGAMNSFTAEGIRRMGTDAGLASHELDKMIKPMSSMSGGLTRLGATSADGVKAFGKMIAVTEQTRMEFQRLGLNDQERIQAQADFIGMMERSGGALSGQLKTSAGLQKASLDYTKNLYELSSITGKSIEESKKDMEIARATYEWKLQENKWARQLKAAQESGNKDEMARIEAEKEGANKLINDVTKLGDPTKTAAVQLQYLTGAITPASSQFAVLGVDIEKQIKAAKENTYQSGEFNDAYKKAADTMLGAGDTALALSEDYRKATGLDEKALNYVNKREGVENEVAAAAESRNKIQENSVNKGVAAQDAAQIARNELTELERKAKIGLDDLVASVNPLMQGFNTTTAAATALTAAAGLAAVALGAMAAKATVGKAIESVSGTGDVGPGKGAPGKGSALKRIGGGLLKGGITALGGTALGMGADYAKSEGHAKTGAGLDIASEAASYAGMGAMLGSVVPGLGTAAGGVVGGLVGAGVGLYKNMGVLTSGGTDGGGVDASSKAMGASTADMKGMPPPKVKVSSAGMSDEEIKAMIIKHEGKRNRPYQDSLGLWTVGIGHLIGDGKSLPPEMNREFSDEEIMAMFEKDYAHHRSAAMNIPGFGKLDGRGQGALTDLTFNMGPSWISKWPKLKKQLEEGDTQGAAKNLEQSKWYGQVGNRAPTIVSLLRDSSKVSASLEGIAEGPESGYSATLHGNELIKRLTKDSILDKLANTPAGDMFSSNATPVDNSELVELMREFVAKMDNLIDAQSDSNSIQSELLQYSKV
jgi:GH24 family phage-related lysozyme (muramidase)